MRVPLVIAAVLWAVMAFEKWRESYVPEAPPREPISYEAKQTWLTIYNLPPPPKEKLYRPSQKAFISDPDK